MSLEEFEAMLTEDGLEPQPAETDNDDGQENAPQDASPVDDKKAFTKSVSDRINKVREEERNTIAKQIYSYSKFAKNERVCVFILFDGVGFRVMIDRADPIKDDILKLLPF